MYEENQVENSACLLLKRRLNSRKNKGNEPKKKHPILEEILEEILELDLVYCCCKYHYGDSLLLCRSSIYN